jgi:hypothetical protein
MKEVAGQQESMEKLRQQRKAVKSSKTFSNSTEIGEESENAITR